MLTNFGRRLYIRSLWALRKRNGRRGRKSAAEKPGDPFSAMRSQGPKIAVIGGGTGLSTLLRGLKKYTQHITAIVTVADDGGGSGVIRRELGMLPPGDIRNCIMALANTEPAMEAILNYRFTEGSLRGQNFGNLFLAALNGVYGSFEVAVERMNEVLAVAGRVLPVTTADVNIEAEFEDGSTVLGESAIYAHKKACGCRLTRVSLRPAGSPALPAALDAIAAADLIILGPGSLYTSVIPNLLVDGVTDALLTSDALKVYVMNIMTQEGETEGYTAEDHIRAILAHVGNRPILDACLVNTAKIPEGLAARYAGEGAAPLYADAGAFDAMGVLLFAAPVARTEGDLARHDPEALAQALIRLFLTDPKKGGWFESYGRLFESAVKNKAGAGV